ncbi:MULTISPECIES: M23 family metallopeptidase [unclassified Microbacterium]|uniref:M23 family metallopeptidase n=1 Tax=unclassified Microbacterium TaxID=2609290 RepID=UPI000EAA3142|nr:MULTISPECIES: M23 family metallopeptidase [unclassified Microbacterium]MBT2486020.1 M23 family metallopeptidase [Microbacterium sp. ISL-108]RKN68761.1 M23 family metallopeptidase [Microbacterium sp. CGR2]
MCGLDAGTPTDAAITKPNLTRRNLFLLTGAAALGASFAANFTRPPSATAAGTYLRPCGNVTISSSWQSHRNRTPASGEPGTDYSVAYGTAVYAATSGVIAARQTSTSGATGRFLALQADDGNYIRYLHLKSISAAVGQRVNRGDLIAVSGASGFGQEYGYGAHVHVSLWIDGTPWRRGFTSTADFENYVGSNTTPPPAPSSSAIYKRNNSMSSLYYTTINGTHHFALAGDGTGSAAWLDTQDQNLANALAVQHGNAAYLTPTSFNSWKARYLENS